MRVFLPQDLVELWVRQMQTQEQGSALGLLGSNHAFPSNHRQLPMVNKNSRKENVKQVPENHLFGFPWHEYLGHVYDGSGLIYNVHACCTPEQKLLSRRISN